MDRTKQYYYKAKQQSQYLYKMFALIVLVVGGNTLGLPAAVMSDELVLRITVHSLGGTLCYALAATAAYEWMRRSQ